jgi:hypothetical protein
LTVLINAIAHTDYSLSGMRIMISIFSDQLGQGIQCKPADISTARVTARFLRHKIAGTS